ncbi:outer membrane protein OmpK [Halopseudomonas bauzanensis]|uniref:Nucleoside-specific outer membrane channel protein Tsx n=1 Tax=Halopseudomonas bauzanensis TaxID=653930 RepID=A0A1H9NM65_9GAMM|nr:outer membrane protein OmpK [Halopseudomonas bauzanensis]SER36981.1 Nucleoside-specific outer membrane channel protein Tsx [Halopseudomonas bauzanensis]SFL80038.1 Nucleoside-specific outer membrane channel protein Tsx [Halopseudomonas bauzanensis]
MHKPIIGIAATTLALASSLAAASPLQWQDNSLTYLYGNDFEVDPKTQQAVTFEHVSGWSFGDLFLFVDSIHYNGAKDANGNNSTWYGEVAPRLSFGKLSGQQLTFGPITDVLLAGTYERGRGDIKNYLLGPGFDLNLPGFDYFQLNTYYRHSDTPDGVRGAWQVTPVWAVTLPVGKSDILIDGYIDWIVDNDGDGKHANLHFNPQVKYDLGKALGWKAKQLYTGIEYSYWKDKYGIKNTAAFDTNQNVTNLLVKVHF